MTDRASDQVFDYLSIGRWSWDRSVDQVNSDAIVGSIFGMSAEGRESQPALRAFLETIHEEDRSAFNVNLERSVNDGGLFRMVYRTQPARGVQKWILAQGRFSKHDPIGRGTVQDVTFAIEENLLGPIFVDARSKRVSSADFIRNFSACTDDVPFKPIIVTKNGRDRLHIASLHRRT